MIIDRLILKNFKRFRNEEIRFSDGITGILGNNGTGKSSIVQAIFFALYGVQATGISPDYVVSSFASPKERCEVRMEFSVGGEKYTVIRWFRKGKSAQHDAEFYHNGLQQAKGVGPVETEVRRTLGMGPVDFKNTIYAGQKDLLTLLESTPGKRKEWFLKALGIDYLSTEGQKILKTWIDNAEGSLRLLEGEHKALSERQDPEEVSRLRAEIIRNTQEIMELEKGKVARKGAREQVEAAIQAFSERKLEHARWTEKKNVLTGEMTRLRRQQEELTRRLTVLSEQDNEYLSLENDVAVLPERKRQLDQLRNIKTQADLIRAGHQSVNRECLELSGRIARIGEKIDQLEKESGKAVSLRGEIRAALMIVGTVPDTTLEVLVATKCRKADQALGTYITRQERLGKDREKILNDQQAIEAAGSDGTCPLCGQRLGEHYAEIESEFAAQLAAIEGEAVSVCASREKLEKEKAILDTLVPKISLLRGCAVAEKQMAEREAERAELVATLGEKEAAGRELAEKLSALQFDPVEFAATEKAVATLEQAIGRYNELTRQRAQAQEVKVQLGDLETQIAENKKTQVDTDTRIAAIPFDPGQGPLLEERRARIIEAENEAATGRARAEERTRHAEEKIRAIEQEQVKILELGKRIATLSEDIDLLNLTRRIIAEYAVYLLQVVRGRIESEVSRIVSEITGGRYEQVLLDDEFNLLVRDVDEDYAIDRFSGGEQDDIAVALRIALSRYLAELHNVHESTLLIFDEIFGSQDEERRNNLLTALRTQESRFPQIILISHIPEMQGEFENTLSVEMGADLSSHVRVVD